MRCTNHKNNKLDTPQTNKSSPNPQMSEENRRKQYFFRSPQKYQSENYSFFHSSILKEEYISAKEEKNGERKINNHQRTS